MQISLIIFLSVYEFDSATILFHIYLSFTLLKAATLKLIWADSYEKNFEVGSRSNYFRENVVLSFDLLKLIFVKSSYFEQAYTSNR